MKYDQREELYKARPELFDKRYRGCANCKHGRISGKRPMIRIGERFSVSCAVRLEGVSTVQIQEENPDLPICQQWEA